MFYYTVLLRQLYPKGIKENKNILNLYKLYDLIKHV